jgi:MinD-like ATPase involved in chromosome partitioning or flagellar assembly
MHRRLRREVGRITGSSRDVHEHATLADVLRQPVTTGRRIAVTSVRGGAGKSTISALIATALAHFRQDRVLALDADPGVGSLMLRLGMVSAPDLRDLVDAPEAGSFDDVRSHLAQTDSALWAVGGGGTIVDGVDLAAYQAVTGLIARFFGVAVIDCGAGLAGDLQQGVLRDAHAHVLVTPATPDGALSARTALDWLADAHADLAARTAVVFVAHTADAGVDYERAARILPPRVADLLRLGFDRHLADGSVIDPARLAEPSRVAALRIAARALTLATGREAGS